MSDNNSYMVFSGTATRYLAEKICQSLGCPLGELQITKFSDGELTLPSAPLPVPSMPSSPISDGLVRTVRTSPA